MSDGIYTALSGAVAMDRNLDVLGNNLANVSTPGFKSIKPSFEAVLAQTQGADTVGGGPDARRDVSISAMSTDLRQGALVQTGNDLDVALEGEGFLSVDTPAGVRYTRRGTMSINAEGELSIGGQAVRAVGGGGIVVPEQAFITIEADGAVFADDVLVGQVEIMRFNNPAAVTPAGGGFYEGNGAVPDEETELVQGFLEESNVNAVWGMTELIRTTRVFEATQKAIQTYKDMDQKLVSEIGRI